jgi:hypothetical protein
VSSTVKKICQHINWQTAPNLVISANSQHTKQCNVTREVGPWLTSAPIGKLLVNSEGHVHVSRVPRFFFLVTSTGKAAVIPSKAHTCITFEANYVVHCRNFCNLYANKNRK